MDLNKMTIIELVQIAMASHRDLSIEINSNGETNINFTIPSIIASTSRIEPNEEK